MGPGPGQRGTPHLLESRVRGGSPPTHVPPGSCCCACWSGESRCVPGTPASAPLQPPSCGDREGATEDMTARAVGPWELHFGPRNSFSERRIQAVKGKTQTTDQENLGFRICKPQPQGPRVVADTEAPGPPPQAGPGGPSTTTTTTPPTHPPPPSTDGRICSGRAGGSQILLYPCCPARV